MSTKTDVPSGAAVRASGFVNRRSPVQSWPPAPEGSENKTRRLEAQFIKGLVDQGVSARAAVRYLGYLNRQATVVASQPARKRSVLAEVRQAVSRLLGGAA